MLTPKRPRVPTRSVLSPISLNARPRLFPVSIKTPRGDSSSTSNLIGTADEPITLSDNESGIIPQKRRAESIAINHPKKTSSATFTLYDDDWVDKSKNRQDFTARTSHSIPLSDDVDWNAASGMLSTARWPGKIRGADSSRDSTTLSDEEDRDAESGVSTTITQSGKVRRADFLRDSTSLSDDEYWDLQEESINGVRQDHDEADAEEQEAEIPEVWREAVQKWRGTDPAIWPAMATFLENASDETMNHIDKVNFAYGASSADVLHLLHWAPDAPSLPEYGTPLDHGECFSIKLLHSIFPELKEHFVFDLFPRRHAMWKSNGKKYTNDEIYGQDPDRQFYKKLAKALVELSTCWIIILYGVPVRDWFMETFAPGAYDETIPVTKNTISGIERSVVDLHHPSYIGRWITREHAFRNFTRLMCVAELGVSVEHNRLNKLLDKAVSDEKLLSSTGDRVTRSVAEKTWEETKVDMRLSRNWSEARWAAARASAAKMHALPKKKQTQKQLTALSSNRMKSWPLPRSDAQLAATNANLKKAQQAPMTEKQLRALAEGRKKPATMPRSEKQMASGKRCGERQAAKARERLEREDKDYLEQHGPEALAQRQADRATRTDYQRDYKERKRAEGFILKKSKWVKKSESETDT